MGWPRKDSAKGDVQDGLDERHGKQHHPRLGHQHGRQDCLMQRWYQRPGIGAIISENNRLTVAVGAISWSNKVSIS